MTTDTPLPPPSDEADLELMRFHLTHSQTNSTAKRVHVLDLLSAARAPLLAERSAMIENVKIARERAERAEARLAEAEGMLKEARTALKYWIADEAMIPHGHENEWLGHMRVLERIDAFLKP